MNKFFTKIAAGLAISKKLKALARKDHVHIDNDIWKKSKKKAEIVDLWHQVSKAGRHQSGDYTLSFPFIEADRTGVDFWCWSNNMPGMGKVIRRKLDDIGIKYDTDED